MNIGRKAYWNGILDRLLTVFYPRRCPFCGQIVEEKALCCESCGEKLSRYRTDQYKICHKCGKLPGSCVCHLTPLFMERHFCPFIYEGLVRDAVLALKRQRERAKPLAAYVWEDLAEYASGWENVIIVPVPASRKGRKQRGYDQAQALARELSFRSGFPYVKKALEKNRDTAAQKTVRRKDRFRNVEGSISLRKGNDFCGKTILLCDDVMTTGATLNECAKVLLNSGAKIVYSCSVATVHRHDNS